MPPRARFTREDIVDAAVRLVEREGIERLTARALGDELNSSARPIFTVFDGMDEVTAAVRAHANAVYGEYVEAGLREPIAFKGVGTAYVKFASERPRLFRLLFMNEREQRTVDNVLPFIEEHYDAILRSVESAYGLNRSDAHALYFHSWIYTHGIASLVATGVCGFTDGQISDALTTVFVALLKKLKSEGKL